MTTHSFRQITYLVDKSADIFSAAETRELVAWLCGMTEAQAAKVNCVSTHTVHSHRKALRQKTGSRTAVDVVVYCLVAGIIRPDFITRSTTEPRDKILRRFIRISREFPAIPATPAKGVSHARV